MRRLTFPRQARRLAACTLVALAAPAGVAAAATTRSVSSNWAGYAIHGSRVHFSHAVGRWVLPQASCTTGRHTYMASWVGLGGYDLNASALEQVGTESDCSALGRASYRAWSELVPAGPVAIGLTVQPGDTISASVNVSGRRVTLRLRDETTRAAYARTRRMSAPDTSSAEWIAEAPSICDNSGNCVPLPLTDFGTMSFLQVSATAGGHTGSVTDSAWSATQIELRGDAGSSFRPGRFGGARSAADAIPSALSAGGASFSITWQHSSPAQAPGPTFPGFGGG